MSAQIKLLRLLRLVENRLCADCDCNLSDQAQGEVFASLGFKTWICGECCKAHVLCLGDSTSKTKSAKAKNWTKEEIDGMIEGKHNVAINLALERYADDSWPKISSESDFEERKLWIRAKYDCFMFAFPHDVDTKRLLGASQRIESVKTSTKKSSEEEEKTKPLQIADSFFVIGPKLTGAPIDKDTQVDPEDVSLKPTILASLNATNGSDVPEFAAQCVFPTGLKFSTEEKDPHLFTFVLTNEARVKIFGAALHIHELLEGEDLERILSLPSTSPAVAHWPVVYSPKSLTITSHYPFFHLMSEFLTVLYHASLSHSPLPLERIVSNFLNELAVPPQGRVQVFYPLPDRVLQLSRPPRNKLPMVDFSFRPLLLCLSIDNILTVFRSLCAELTVCVLSSNVSLLTPVQEALISLLFPMHWQGCYIPVMPLNMKDILEAPVPFLVGLDTQYLRLTRPKHRPANVVFVNLDTDTIEYGGGVETSGVDQFGAVSGPWPPPPLPKAMVQKLKSKLEECAAKVRGGTGLLRLQAAGRVYPHKEHLTPMRAFYGNTLESKVGAPTAGRTTTLSSSSLSSSSLMSSTPLNDAVASTVTVSIRSGAPEPMSRESHASRSSLGLRIGGGGGGTGKSVPLSSNPSSSSVLDPINNAQSSDGFDANELRYAFLRVFLVSLNDYTEFFTGSSKQSQPKRGATVGVGAMNDGKGSLQEEKGAATKKFDMDAFQAAHADPFTSTLARTQMFSKFIDENSEDMPEVTYFLESITRKKNRSSLNFGRLSTPFLDDRSEDVSSTVNAPEPSSWGIPIGKTFTYSHFPTTFDPSVIGPLRPAPVLVQAPEPIRATAESSSMTQLMRTMLHLSHDRSTTRRGNNDSNPTGGLGSVGGAGAGAGAGAGVVGTTGSSDKTHQRRTILNETKKRNRRVERGIIVLQAAARQRIRRKIYLRTLWGVYFVQFFVRRWRLRRKWALQQRLRELRVLTGKVVQVQAWLRGAVWRVAFARFRRAVVRLQSMLRRHILRRKYVKLLRRVVFCQAVAKGERLRRQFIRARLARITAMRQQALLLWQVECTPLLHRSKWWTAVDEVLRHRKPSCLVERVVEDELLRLYESLGFYLDRGLSSAAGGKLTKKMNFQAQFDAVGRSAVMDATLRAAPNATPSSGPQPGLLHASVQAKVSVALAAEKAERKDIYVRLKANVAEATRNSFYPNFPSLGRKKRKEGLSRVLWCVVTAEGAMASRAVVFTALGVAGPEAIEWFRRTQVDKRMRQAFLAAVQSSMVALQRERSNGSTSRSNRSEAKVRGRDK